MIVYFADRRLSILGMATSELGSEICIIDDEFTSNVDMGVATLSLDIQFTSASRKRIESMADAGNYVLYKHKGRASFFTIIDYDEDVDAQTLSLYMEDGGLDLLNDSAIPFIANDKKTIDWYLERELINTGFEVAIDGDVDKTKKLQLGWDSSSTITNRILSIAGAFEVEVDYDFEIEGLVLTHKYVRIHKKIGKNVSARLTLGKELNNLKIKKSVANLATALEVVGGRDDGRIDLSGVGCILIGNEYAFGNGEEGGNGWVDGFYEQTNCLGYAIRQPGGDFSAKGNSHSTYPDKNYAECLDTFMATDSSGSQTKTITVDGPRGYRLSLTLSWTRPENDSDTLTVNYALKLISGGTYRFSQFSIGWEVKIADQNANIRPRSGAPKQSIALNSTLTLCSGSVSITQTSDPIQVSALIDMATKSSQGVAVAPGPMNLSGEFKPVIDEDDPRKAIRFIIVGGGVNDLSSSRNSSGESGIKEGIDAFVASARLNFPYAKVYFVPLFSTIEGNVLDQSKTVKANVDRSSFTEQNWNTYSVIGHEETWNDTASSRGECKKKDLFTIKGTSTDGGWIHTVIYECDNDTGDLHGHCVGHLIDNVDLLTDYWVSYARKKGVYTVSKSLEWFRGVSDYRPEEGSVMFMTDNGYRTDGNLIANFLAGWDGDIYSSGSTSSRYVTLEGREYDDGDFYIDGTLLKSREAVSKWTRYVDRQHAYTNSYHLVRSFSYDTTNQDELLARAIEELKKLREPSVTYEADVLYLPANVDRGDTVTIIDEEGALFLETRILEISHSETSGKDKIVFGDFVVKTSGISQMVYDLAAAFSAEAAKTKFYTWTVYAEDTKGTGISLTKTLRSKYIGIASYRTMPEPDLTDPSVFKWSMIDTVPIIVKITSSQGLYFEDSKIATTLTANVYSGGRPMSSEEVFQIGDLNWYKNGTYVHTGTTYTILPIDNVYNAVIEARLEDDTDHRIEPEGG